MRRVLALLCVLPALVLAGCGGDDSDSSTTTLAADTTQTETTAATTAETTTDSDTAPVGCVDADMPSTDARTVEKPEDQLDESKTYEVTFDTNCGSFTVTLDQQQSPNATASIVSLVKAGYFDNTVFHRIVPGFVIQGGDPTASGTGGPGYSTVDPPPSDAAYTHGVVAMAKAEGEPAGTAGSQFFVVTVPDSELTPDYAIIGNVTEGLEVVDAIGQLGDANQQPTQVVEIEKATVTES